MFRNTETPIFRLLREGLREAQVHIPEIDSIPIVDGKVGADVPARLRRIAGEWKIKAARMLPLEGQDSVIYLDADCLALRGIEHLLDGEWDIRYHLELGKVSSAIYAVRAEVLPQVMDAWEAHWGTLDTDHTSWEKVILACKAGKLPWKAVPFEKHYTIG